MAESKMYSNPMRQPGASKTGVELAGRRDSTSYMRGWQSVSTSRKPKRSAEIIKIGGRPVELYNDECFSRIRRRFGIDDAALASTEEFDWQDMRPSDGKGGDEMARSKDLRFFVKEIKGDDQHTLLRVTSSYAQHVVGDSFICRFFFHFKSGKKSYVVMNNWLPKPITTYHEDKYKHIFDLKGAADDKMMLRDYETVKQIHARCWHCCTHCGCKRTSERVKYRSGKDYSRRCHFFLSYEDRARVMGIVHQDAQWLRENGLMDYSLIVGIKECKQPDFEAKFLPRGGFSTGDDGGLGHAQPYYGLHNNKVYGVYIGIIDFLQGWTCKKVIAHHIKCCDRKPLATVNPHEYGIRFVDYFNKKIVAADRTTKLPHWFRQLSGHAAAEVGGSKTQAAAAPERATAVAVNAPQTPSQSATAANETGAAKDAVSPSPVKQIATAAGMILTAASIAAYQYAAENAGMS